jgi:hypothetical protein
MGVVSGDLKSWLIISVLTAALVANAGCICAPDNLSERITTPTGEPDDSSDEAEIREFMDALSESDVDFDTSNFNAVDADGDGRDDKYTLTFEAEQVTDGLTLDKSVEYETTGEGLMGSITLDFESTWADDTRTHTHRETIPKSFAESVADLEFSVQPDRIVNPDPDVEWVIAGINKRLKIDSRVAVAEATADEMVKSDLVAPHIAKDFLGFYLTPEEKKKMQAAEDVGLSVKLGTVLERFDDFRAINGLRKCEAIKDERKKYVCLMGVFASYPDSFEEDDCDEFHFDEVMSSLGGSLASRGACKALLTGDVSKCTDTMHNPYMSDEAKERRCRLQMFFFYSATCQGIREQQSRKECNFLAALESGSAAICKSKTLSLDDKLKKLCLALNTKDVTYCQKMEKQEDFKTCCDLLGPTLKEKCLKKQECDSEHLTLCDNEKDCEASGGHWHNNKCNKEQERGIKQDEEKEQPVTQGGCGGLGQECCDKGTCYNMGSQRLVCDLLVKPRVCVVCGNVGQTVCRTPEGSKEDLRCNSGLKPCNVKGEIDICRSCGCWNQRPCGEGQPCYGGNIIQRKGYCVDKYKCGEHPLFGKRSCTDDKVCTNMCPWMSCVDGHCAPWPP